MQCWCTRRGGQTNDAVHKARRLSRSNSAANFSSNASDDPEVPPSPTGSTSSPKRVPKTLAKGAPTTPKGSAPTTPKGSSMPSPSPKNGGGPRTGPLTTSFSEMDDLSLPSAAASPSSAAGADHSKGPSQAAVRRASVMLNASAPPPKAKPAMVPTGLVGEVSDTLSLFVTTWNMAGISVPEASALDAWLPYGFDLYVIALQECKKPSAMDKHVCEHLGGEEKYESFKTVEMGSSTMLVFARQKFFKGGVLALTRLNGARKFEIKSKGIMGGATGRGAILVQVLFHNTIMAFLSVVLDGDPGGLATRVSDMEWILRQSGVILPDKHDIGTPALHTVQHVFLMGEFGVKLSPKVTDVSGRKAWSVTRWNAVRDLKDDEFAVMMAKVPVLEQFWEEDVSFPPTSRRVTKPAPKASPRVRRAASVEDMDQLVENTTVGREPSPSILSMFEHEFDVAELFDAKLIKKEGLPSWQARIRYRTHDDYAHLINPGVYLSSEMMRLSPNVPVYSTFSVNGVDATLLKRWQVITGNMPPENASRTDERMVTGMVEDLLGAFQQNEAVERHNQEIISKMKRCLRCAQPLSLHGGDVDLEEKGAFHRGCFTCEDCGADLFGKKIMHIDDRWLCFDSYEQLYRRPCPVCGLVVAHGLLRCGKNEVGYHSTCFRCTDCKKFLFNGNDVLPHADLDDKPYCPECNAKHRAEFCIACKTPLKQADAVAGFHRACFRCRACDLDMTTTSLKVVVRDYYVYCQTHAKVELTKRKKTALSLAAPSTVGGGGGGGDDEDDDGAGSKVEEPVVEDEFDLSDLPPPPPLPISSEDTWLLNLPPPPPLSERRKSVVERPRVVVNSSDEEE